MGAQESRRDRRYAVDMPALLIAGKLASEVVVKDVSFRGLFIHTPTPPRLRDLVRVRMVLTGGQQFQSQATVVRVVELDGTTGVGLQLFALDTEAEKRWRELVASVRVQTESSPGLAPVVDASPPARRRFKRFTMVLQVRLTTCGQIHELFSQDLSMGGVFLDTPLPLPLGEKVVVQLVHPETGQPFDVEGEVRRRVKDGPARGIAVEFMGLVPDRRRELMDFITGAHLFEHVETPIEIELPAH